MNATILDRKELRLTAFWEKFKEESKASRPVHIRTGCKEWAELPLDIFGLGEASREYECCSQRSFFIHSIKSNNNTRNSESDRCFGNLCSCHISCLKKV